MTFEEWFTEHKDWYLTSYGITQSPSRLDCTMAWQAAAPKWKPIETAPKDRSVLLCCANTTLPIYCGRYRYGNLGEPQQDILAWRCDSSGRFANPTHWMELPPAPEE